MRGIVDEFLQTGRRGIHTGRRYIQRFLLGLSGNRKQKKGDAEKPWYKQIPKFGGNPAYEEAAKLGREYRESQRDFEDEK